MSTCYKCSDSFVKLKECIVCSECSNSFHPTCTRISSVASFKKISATKKLLWKCDDCHDESSSTASGASRNDADPGTSKLLEYMEGMRRDMCLQFNIVNENVSEVKGQLTVVNSAVDDLKLALAKLTTENEERKCEYTKITKQNEALKSEVGFLRDQVLDLQQYTRKNNLEIVGVPETKGEDIYCVLKHIAEYINVPYAREDISVAHRLPVRRRDTARGSATHPNIIVSFITRTTKSSWRAASKGKKLMAADLCDKFPSTRIFLNDHLTPHNKAVLGRARRYVKENKLAMAWTSDCKVLVKKTTTGQASRVWCFQDVDDAVESNKQ